MNDGLDISQEQQERIAAKLLADYRPGSVLDGFGETERRWAENLLGSSEIARLDRCRRGERFRYRKPVHTVEYGFDDGAGGWYADIFENGRRKAWRRDLDDHQIQLILRALALRGIPVRLFQTEAQKVSPPRSRPPATNPGPCHKNKPDSRRRALLDSLENFRL